MYEHHLKWHTTSDTNVALSDSHKDYIDGVVDATTLIEFNSNLSAVPSSAPKITLICNHKSVYGLLGAMLRQVALTYPHADIDEFYDLDLYFVQASNTSINLWSMSYMECDLYDMWREESVQLPVTFETKEDLVVVIQFFWTLKEKLLTTLNVLNNLKQQHAANKRSKRYLQGKSALLTDFKNPSLEKSSKENI